MRNSSTDRSTGTTEKKNLGYSCGYSCGCGSGVGGGVGVGQWSRCRRAPRRRDPSQQLVFESPSGSESADADRLSIFLSDWIGNVAGNGADR